MESNKNNILKEIIAKLKKTSNDLIDKGYLLDHPLNHVLAALSINGKTDISSEEDKTFAKTITTTIIDSLEERAGQLDLRVVENGIVVKNPDPSCVEEVCYKLLEQLMRELIQLNGQPDQEDSEDSFDNNTVPSNSRMH